MILAYEPCWPGSVHANINSTILQIVAHAFPDQRLRVLADPTHLHELRQDAPLAALPGIEFVTAEISRHFRYRTGIVSPRRFLDEFTTLAAAMRRVPTGERLLVLLLSATPTMIFAASALARLRGRCGVQVVLHGNLNDAQGWRPRNPLLRRFDLAAALRARHGGRLRFLVLEGSIHRALARLWPHAAAIADILPHPVNPAEAASAAPAPMSPPLRVGFVGGAATVKGIDTFLDIAREFRAAYGERVAFHLVGNARRGTDLAAFAVLAHPVGFETLSRAEFTARLGSLHYVMLPFRPDYYTLSASGGLVDAITWLKPVLTTRVPLVEDMFAEHGEIGALCDDAAGLRAALAAALVDGTGERYAARAAAMRRLRDSRMPRALATQYGVATRAHFPGLLN